jgi:Mn-dependent DtxR family transcriptional regulator
MSETNNEGAIIVPEMVNLDSLTKIIIAYEKAGGSQKEVSTKEVAQISGMDPSNVGLNNKFFASIGLLEGKKGGYKLTTSGSEYAKALDWGRLEEAQSLLRRIIKDKPLVQKTVSYVELNKPVQKDDLVAKIAIFAEVPNQPRFSTGIKAFVEMLTLSKVLEEKEGTLVPVAREEPKETFVSSTQIPTGDIEFKAFGEWRSFLERIKQETSVTDTTKAFLGFTVTINVDNNTDPEKLKQIIKVIKDAALTRTTETKTTD